MSIIENKFLKKFEYKTDLELEVIIKDKASYTEDARTANQKVEKRLEIRVT
jgi:hypothetical protein